MRVFSLCMFSVLLVACIDYNNEISGDASENKRSRRRFANSQPAVDKEGYGADKTDQPSVDMESGDENGKNGSDQDAKNGSGDNINTRVADETFLFKNCDQNTSAAFVADIYRVERDTNRMPDVANLRSWGTFCKIDLRIPAGSYEDIFPGMPEIDSFFIANVRFDLNIEFAGEYTFFLTSDNGSKLTIDNIIVIDNDGKHEGQLKTGTAFLYPGLRSINLAYMQLDGSMSLELRWQKPGDAAPSEIPLNLVSKP